MGNPLQHLVQRAVFKDPVPGGVINQRFLITMVTFGSMCELGQESTAFMRTITMIANKLAAVWYHMDRYKAAEDREIASGRANPVAHDADNVLLDYSPELGFEFDSFLVQVKSCLDHVVQIAKPFVGKGWTLATFGDHGKDVIKAARNNVPERLASFAEGLVMVVENNQDWLPMVIDARNRINHMQEGGIHPAEVFGVSARRDAEGTITIKVPQWSPDQTMRQFMEVAWPSLFGLCEDFTASCIAMKVPDNSVLARVRPGPIDLSSLESPWVVAPANVMKATVEASPKDWTIRKPPSRAERRGKGRGRG